MKTFQNTLNITYLIARWGVAEWIEHPLLMLKVWGSNPDHSASQNTTSLPRNPRVLIRGRVQLRILELGDEAWEKQVAEGKC